MIKLLCRCVIKMKCCVLGSGTWGSALAQVLSDNSNEVIIYGRDVEEVSDINNNH